MLSTLRPSEAPEKELIAIDVTTAPTKTTYTEGEVFDPAGMVVTGTYSDESTEEVTDYTYEPTGELTSDITAITVKKGDFTDLVNIVVNEVEEEKIGD